MDEKPTIRVLERLLPTQRMAPGKIERQEFEYRRHGVVNLLVGLRLHDGAMWSECLEANNSEHFQATVGRLLETYPPTQRITLIMDNGPSHTSQSTTTWFASFGSRIHVLFTPKRASWLNQAELLLRSFAHRHLNRGTWKGRDKMVAHLADSTVEYNVRWAHPFSWSWGKDRFCDWLNKAHGLYPSAILATLH